MIDAMSIYTYVYTMFSVNFFVVFWWQEWAVLQDARVSDLLSFVKMPLPFCSVVRLSFLSRREKCEHYLV